MSRHALKGSERRPVQGARPIAPADPDERLEVTVLVRRRAGADLKAHVSGLAARGGKGAHLRREAFAARFGADPQDMEAVRRFAAGHGLAVVQEDLGRRTLVLSGTVGQVAAAFGVQLEQFEHEGGHYRGRTGPVTIPEELDGIILGVLGLDNRPIAQPHFRGGVAPRATAASFTPKQLAELYDFPPGAGEGQCVGIIELGGGFRPGDLRTYFTKLSVPNPRVTAVSVDHGRNHPTGDASGPDGEVMLDIEVVGAVAPAAKIVVYFAPNTDAGFLDAITTAIHDTANRPSVISISWGSAESAWTEQAMTAFDQAFQAAAAMGITVCAAAGDNGSSDGVNDGQDHVDFPASSPFCLACGGTRVQASGSAISAETVWNDGAGGGATGGGVSAFFPVPPWQQGLRVARIGGGTEPLQRRGVPDVSGNADPETGYDVLVDGASSVIGGTSAVAPLWAGLVAVINGASGTQAGLLQPALYADGAALRDIVQGNNGSFAAGAGWDACTGLGSPDGKKVAAALRAASSPPPTA